MRNDIGIAFSNSASELWPPLGARKRDCRFTGKSNRLYVDASCSSRLISGWAVVRYRWGPPGFNQRHYRHQPVG